GLTSRPAATLGLAGTLCYYVRRSMHSLDNVAARGDLPQTQIKAVRDIFCSAEQNRQRTPRPTPVTSRPSCITASRCQSTSWTVPFPGIPRGRQRASRSSEYLGPEARCQEKPDHWATNSPFQRWRISPSDGNSTPLPCLRRRAPPQA